MVLHAKSRAEQPPLKSRSKSRLASPKRLLWRAPMASSSISRARSIHDVKLSILTAKDPDAVQVLRHSAAHLLAAAVLELYPGRKARRRPADRHRLFLRIRARPAVHSGRPRENRGQNARACREGHSQRTQDDAEARGARALSQIESGIQMRAGRGKGRRADGVVSTPPANSSTSAAARTSRPPGASRRSS